MSPTRTAPELLTSLTTGWNDAMQQWWDQSQATFDPWRHAWEAMMPDVAGQTFGMPSGRHHAHGSSSGCGCELAHEHADTSCGCGNPCRCCIPDADVVLHARAGEQRVIPFLLRNPWRREREVTIAVGPWQVCNGGRLEVRSVVDAEESLTLQACETRVVRLGIVVRGICDDGQDTKRDTEDHQRDHTKGSKQSTGKTASAATADKTAGVDADSFLSTTRSTDGKRFGCDVESCASAYADVRFEGCARPQRIAVVVHPAICEAVELPCDCGCCG